MKVLVMTGGLVSGNEPSVWSVGRRLFRQWLASEHAWLDLKIKLVFAEFLLRRPRVEIDALSTPDLTEVVLATMLQREAMPYALLMATCSITRGACVDCSTRLTVCSSLPLFSAT